MALLGKKSVSFTDAPGGPNTRMEVYPQDKHHFRRHQEGWIGEPRPLPDILVSRRGHLVGIMHPMAMRLGACLPVVRAIGSQMDTTHQSPRTTVHPQQPGATPRVVNDSPIQECCTGADGGGIRLSHHQTMSLTQTLTKMTTTKNPEPPYRKDHQDQRHPRWRPSLGRRVHGSRSGSSSSRRPNHMAGTRRQS